jgi:[protein-PII] uridylyltransferase
MPTKDDDPQTLIRGLKHSIQQFSLELIARFGQGDDVTGLLLARARFMDALLCRCWQHFLGNDAARLALVAVGGYGRGELHPHSDIDILVLLETIPGEDSPLSLALGRFFNCLWDIGLKPAQSVRTLDDCVEHARQDQTVITNLLESHLIYGSESLYHALNVRMDPEYIWPSARFFEAKMAEQKLRYAKYHDTAYNLEPNVKEGPGGLRDIQLIGWIIKRHYHTGNFLEVLLHGWLTDAEYAELMEARNFLSRIRFALHVLTGRSEDRLLFEYQQELARQFGYQGADVNETVELFMQHYFRTVMGLERLNEMLLQLFKEVVLVGDETCSVIPVDDQFQVVNRYIEAVHPDVFSQNPLALLRIFLLLQQNASLIGIRASTIRLIRQHLHLIDAAFRDNPEACRLFMEILRLPGGVNQLRQMNRYGVLAAYLPEFGRVVGRMQYDLFHVYTVDEHTLFVVRNLWRFSQSGYEADHPLCSELFESLQKPELLYIAALMHDIAKGSGGDHSTLGADIAERFCQRHAVAPHDTERVKWLVEHHLLMSMTAQRKDISDPEVIHDFATRVGDQEALCHLYLLTVADIRATNPNLWNSWKDALLKELFLSTRWMFRRGLARPVEQTEKIGAIQQQSRALLTRLGVPEATVGRVWSTLNEEYFSRYLPEEIAWHTIALGACSPEDYPLVLLRPMSQRGSAEIFIYAKNQEFLFARATAVLDQLGLTIFDAKVITTVNDDLLNSYHVLEHTGESIRDHYRQIQICVKLRECLMQPTPTPIEVLRREPRQVRHFAVRTEIYFHEDPQNRYTVLELNATDRPGLLSKVGQAFGHCHIKLYNARISTIGSRAEDIFYITDCMDRPLKNEARQRELTESIIGLIGSS